MKSFLKVAALMAAAQLAIGSAPAEAGKPLVVKPASCNCSQNSGSVGAFAPTPEAYAAPAPVYDGHAVDAYGGHGVQPYDGHAIDAPAYDGHVVGNGFIGPPAAAVAVGGGPVAAGPPPGTVGMTYRRPSRHIPEDKHPRVGMLVVEAPGATAMAVEGMKGFQDTDGFWQFESKEPLLPGIPHIYHVKARIGAGPDAPVEFRTVRLIPGRIIDLDW